ncbi:MAG: hypothetical protein DHS20C17_29330 [Cyclobacteriaceae bacterium]|nr:MAG: hypothetical protein DHS20C17_29330 [Cyclobacteriaceae bacterium]
MNTKEVLMRIKFVARYRTYLLVVLTAMILINCSDDDEPDSMQIPDSATTKALALISGTVTETQLETEDGVAAWKVDITAAQGAEVEIYCRQSDNTLLRIDGEQGPFDYNINPGNGLIDFNQAKTIAAGQTGENLESWQLRTEDKYSNQWVYTMEHASVKVFINAVDGTVLDVES